MQISDSIVIIPTYNERENIENIIRAVFGLPKIFHILVIEDGSPDGTANIVKTLQQEFPERLFMIERKGKLGLGTAYIAGFKWALEHSYEYIFEMDADFSHNPNDLPRLYQACAEARGDVAVGSRYVSGVNVVNWPMGRVLMSYFASKYVQFITGIPIHDTTAGFVCYRRQVLETIDLEHIRFKGYAFQIEMKFTAYKCGFKIIEVPVIFINRELGTSKMNSSIFGEAVFGVIKLKVNSWFHKFPKEMKRTLIQNAVIVNEGRKVLGSVVIEGEKIAEILTGEEKTTTPCDEIIDATGCYLLPGAIDEHVHFRDPGLTHKADITTESRAAAAGGVTSIMDMPNTNPQTTTLEALDEKLALLAGKSAVNYSCYFGATNNNYPQFAQLDKHRVCGVKLFMGSSTGNMLVDRMASLRNIFGGTDLLIAAHCEDQGIIKENTDKYKKAYGDDVPLTLHPVIRSEEACYRSSELAVQLAREANARLHIMHISTARELDLFSDAPLITKRITAEACVSHLLFTEDDYQTLGARIKCNPAIKTAEDRKALQEAVNSGLIDAIATDHAPHLLSEKEGGALKAMSGMPMIQFSLASMLELVDKDIFSIEKIVEKMSHAPAQMYEINNRGFIHKGYQADLVLVRPNSKWTVTTDCIVSKCQWSPLEGHTFNWKVEKTFVNGHLLYDNGKIDETYRGQELRFR